MATSKLHNDSPRQAARGDMRPGMPVGLRGDLHQTASARDAEMNLLTEHLATRRKTILQTWHNAIRTDEQLKTARTLGRGQLNDHIPQVLDAFEHKLRSRPGGQPAQDADRQQKTEHVKHGLHRWQQGYPLPELVREWGHLQLCLFDEVYVFAANHPEIDRSTIVKVVREMIHLVNEAVSESCNQYERMQQAEALGRVKFLEAAVARIGDVERRRSSLIREAVHDLSGNVLGVRLTANRLCAAEMSQTEREECSSLLHQGIQAVNAMLLDLTELARLESGKETRAISTFDVAALVKDVGDVNRPVAESRGLFLRVEGPPQLAVDGDSSKVRRMLQNLLLNALKYTDHGGVLVSLGSEEERWWLMINDTGPGLQAGADNSQTVGMKEATASARESDEIATGGEGEVSQVLVPVPGGTPAVPSSVFQPSEGIGLTIVKRLCELLDASLEVASSASTGTTFRVLFPRHYGPRRSQPSNRQTHDPIPVL